MKTDRQTILRAFFDTQMYEHEGRYYHEDERPLLTYKKLELETGLPKHILRHEVIELRNDGVVELCPAVDYDAIPNGSGYDLTNNGVALCKELFANPTHHD